MCWVLREEGSFNLCLVFFLDGNVRSIVGIFRRKKLAVGYIFWPPSEEQSHYKCLVRSKHCLYCKIFTEVLSCRRENYVESCCYFLNHLSLNTRLAAMILSFYHLSNCIVRNMVMLWNSFGKWSFWFSVFVIRERRVTSVTDFVVEIENSSLLNNFASFRRSRVEQ